MELWVGKYLVEHGQDSLVTVHMQGVYSVLNENDSNRRNNRQDDQLMQ
jgi:hypothetical protein